MTNFYKSIVIFGILFFVPLLFNKSVRAAQLYLSPSTGEYYVGNTLTLGVYIDSTEGINAVDSTITYDSSFLSISSCTSGGNGFETPIPTSTTGCTNLVSGTTGTFSGTGGQVGSITFKIKAAGTASIGVSGQSANNGVAVNTSGSNASFTFSVYHAPILAPDAVVVRSLSHPVEDDWYSEKIVNLSWEKDSNILGFSYVFDQNANTQPEDNIITTGTGADLEISKEGIWYFHIKSKTVGGWGPVTTYKVQYDNTPPQISKLQGVYFGDLQPVFTINVDDSLAGMDTIEISVDKADFYSIKSPYKLPAISLGIHDFQIKVTDKAGNFLLQKADVSIDYIAIPTITDFSFAQTFVGENTNRLIFSGTAPAGASVLIQIQPGDILVEASTDNNGSWSTNYTGLLEKGDYSMVVQSYINGSYSEFSSPTNFTLNNETGIGTLPLTGGSDSSSFLGVALVALGGLLIVGVFSYLIYLKLKKKRDAQSSADPIPMI